MREQDRIRKITDYIKGNLSKGYTLESLKWALINQGYSRTLVSRAIDEANKELAKSAPKLKEKPMIKYQIIDEYDKPVKIQKSFLRKFFEGLFK